MKNNNNSYKNEFSVTYDLTYNDRNIKIIIKEYSMSVYINDKFEMDICTKNRAWGHAKNFRLNKLDEYIDKLVLSRDITKQMINLDMAYWLNKLRQYLWYDI